MAVPIVNVKAHYETKNEIETLIEGKAIEKPVHEDITYDEVYDTMDEESKFIELTIPNKEVKYIFKNKILKWFKDKIKARDFSQMYDAIILGNKNVKQNSIK